MASRSPCIYCHSPYQLDILRRKRVWKVRHKIAISMLINMSIESLFAIITLTVINLETSMTCTCCENNPSIFS